MATSTKKVILVTGGNSGVGLDCCRSLVQQDNIHVILVGRDQERVDEAVKDVQQRAVVTSSVEGGLADLSSLQSVRAYCESFLTRKIELFALVLNAGVQTAEKHLTEDGFELTFEVNYLGHFLMLKLLKDHTKRIITLSSETHDPAWHSPVPLPDVSDLDQLVVGYSPFNGAVAYSTSKLLTTIVAKEFPRRYPDGAEILAYAPGFVPDTALHRSHANFDPVKVAELAKSRGVRVSTSAYSGSVLAKIASADSWAENGWHSADFMSVDEVYPASKQANDEALGKLVWDKSEQWIAVK